MEYMKRYNVRMNFRMTEEERDELQRRARQLDVSTAAMVRLLIKQLKKLHNNEFYF